MSGPGLKKGQFKDDLDALFNGDEVFENFDNEEFTEDDELSDDDFDELDELDISIGSQ